MFMIPDYFLPRWSVPEYVFLFVATLCLLTSGTKDVPENCSSIYLFLLLCFFSLKLHVVELTQTRAGFKCFNSRFNLKLNDIDRFIGNKCRSTVSTKRVIDNYLTFNTKRSMFKNSLPCFFLRFWFLNLSILWHRMGLAIILNSVLEIC